MQEGTIIEALVIAAIIGSLTLTTCLGVIAGDDYVKILMTFMGYVLGRIFNTVQHKE